MRAKHELSRRVLVSFDEPNLVANAGLLPAAFLAQRLDLGGPIGSRLHLAEHGANSGAKALSVIGSMLAGGHSIDDVAVPRSGAAAELFDETRAPSTVGAWLRAHKWSNAVGSSRVRRSATPRSAATLQPIPYWLRTPEVSGDDIPKTPFTVFAGDKRHARQVQVLVRRVRPAPGSQLALFTAWDYNGFITDRTLPLDESRPTIAGTPWLSRPSLSSRAPGWRTCPRAHSWPTPPASR